MKKTIIFFSSLLVMASAHAQKSNDGKVRNLDEVVVSASRTEAKLSELPNKVEIITKTDISLSSANNLGELLKANTGVDLVQYPGFLSSIGMRGFAPGLSTRYVNLLVDGVPAGTTNLSTLMLSGVERVEVLKGPFSSLYGSAAMGGLVNVVPVKNKAKLTGHAGFSYGSAKMMKGSLALGGKIFKGLSFDLNAFYGERKKDYMIGASNFFQLNPTEKAILSKETFGAKMDNSTFKNWGGGLRLGYDFNPNWSVNLYGSMFAAVDVLTNGSFWGSYGQSKKNLLYYNTRMEVQGRVSNHLLKLVPHFSYDTNDYTGLTKQKDNSLKEGFKTSESVTKTAGVSFSDIMSFGTHKLTVGFDNLNTYSEVFSFSPKDGTEQAPYNPNYYNNTIGAFTQANLKFLDGRLNLSAGLRYDLIKLTLEANDFLKNQEKAEVYSKLSPNFGLKYEVLKNTFVHASYGQAFIAPTALQKAGEYTTVGQWAMTTKGNPDLLGESSNTFDVGLAYSNRDCGLDFDVTYFHSNHKDFIINDNNLKDENGKIYKSFKNANKAEMEGIEVMASYDLGHIWDYEHSVKFFFNGTFMLKTKVLEKGQEEWRDMIGVSDKQMNFGLDIAPIKPLHFRLSARYIGSRIENNFYTWYPDVRKGLAALLVKSQPENAKLALLKQPKFMIFDAAISYNLYRGLVLSLKANNIFNENYTYVDGYNMQARNLMANLSYRF